MLKRRWAVLHIVWMAAACEHGAPFMVEGEGAGRGPFRATNPLQLTFNPAPDLLGAPWGDSLAYTAFLPAGDGCLAIVALAGGTRHLACPDTLMADSWSWIEPAVSPDGAWIAYVEERRVAPGAPLVTERRLVVAPRDRPAEATTLIESSFVDGAGVRVNAFRGLTWIDVDRIRFIGDTQSFGPLGTRVPVARYDLQRAGGGITRLPGAAPLAWARADGTDWVVEADAPQGLYRLADDGTRSHVVDILWNVVAVAVVGGRPVILEIRPPQEPGAVPDTLVQLYDPDTGAVIGSVAVGGVAQALRPVSGRRAVVVQVAGLTPANLWYAEVP